MVTQRNARVKKVMGKRIKIKTSKIRERRLAVFKSSNAIHALYMPVVKVDILKKVQWHIPTYKQAGLGP